MTYQAASGAGAPNMRELLEQMGVAHASAATLLRDPSSAILDIDRAVTDCLRSDALPQAQFGAALAGSLIPWIDKDLGNGQSREEWKGGAETNKILSPDIGVTATCVRVPVFVGHSEAISVEFERPISVAKAQSLLREAPGVMLIDKREDGGYVTPVECVGDYATFVSRVRKDPTVQNGLSFWCVSDNLRKGAALNAVQIAELLGRRHLKKA
jgi:aspartate-semialdehyde dehydrogenase